MSKRFTETMKWNDPWFRRLSPENKLLWLYLTDQCDNAGVWQVDWDDASFRINSKVDATNLDSLNAEKARAKLFNEGRKLFLFDFVEFQIMNLNNVTMDSKLTNLQKNCIALVAKYISTEQLTADDFKLITGKDAVLYEYLTSIGKGIGNSNGNNTNIDKDHAEIIIATWNEAIKGTPLTRLERWTPKRSKHYKARIAEWSGDENAMWIAIREQIQNLDAFAKGGNDRKWMITFDWMIESEQNLTKLIEGNYRYKGTHR